jgi:hypothetical protein
MGGWARVYVVRASICENSLILSDRRKSNAAYASPKLSTLGLYLCRVTRSQDVEVGERGWHILVAAGRASL